MKRHYYTVKLLEDGEYHFLFFPFNRELINDSIAVSGGYKNQKSALQGIDTLKGYLASAKTDDFVIEKKQSPDNKYIGYVFTYKYGKNQIYKYMPYYQLSKCKYGIQSLLKYYDDAEVR